MSTALLLLLAFAGLAPADELRVLSVTALPEEVEIGEPATIMVVVEHAPGERFLPPPESPAGEDPGWALLSGPDRVVADRTPERGRAATAWGWTYMVLEAGERALPPFELRTEGGETVTVEPPAITVRPSLLEGEDLARKLPGLHPVADERPPLRIGHVGALLLALVAVGFFVTRLRRGVDPGEEPPTPAALLADLRERELDDPAVARAVTYELTRIARGAVDRARERDGSGFTDEEWLAGARGDLPAAAREPVDNLLAAAGDIKYGGSVPTRFKVEELLGVADGLVRTLEAGDGPAGSAGNPKGGRA